MLPKDMHSNPVGGRCEWCGTVYAAGANHRCTEQWIRNQSAMLVRELTYWLETTEGRFELYYAQRTR